MKLFTTITTIITLTLLLFSCGSNTEVVVKHLDNYEITPTDTEEQIREKLVGVETIGQLNIFNQDELVDLKLFEHLTSINKLLLSGCDGLISMEGLGSVAINGQVIITNCDNLISIADLDNLNEIELLDVTNCQSLELIELNNCISIDDFQIGPVHSLEEISMSNLRIIDEGLNIYGCPNLLELKLPSLEEVNGLFGIQTNLFIPNLDHLTALRKVDHILIRSNATLTNIDGLASLTEVGKIEMRNNKIEEFCVFKNAVLNNPTIDLDIQGTTIYAIERDYFNDCP